MLWWVKVDWLSGVLVAVDGLNQVDTFSVVI